MTFNIRKVYLYILPFFFLVHGKMKLKKPKQKAKGEGDADVSDVCFMI
jgi:hypothetical protein